MEITSKDIHKIIFETLKDLKFLGVKLDELEGESEDLVLYGAGGLLDSLSLIHFIAAIEEKILISFDIKLSLVEEGALSMRRSPFRSFSTLTDFVLEQMKLHG